MDKFDLLDLLEAADRVSELATTLGKLGHPQTMQTLLEAAKEAKAS
jgi:hypothetical protein